ncbi:MAG TPA: hypothetical protein VEB18_04385 [Candidatus Paceibacterota bacterium]|nr:hypothetical protein [Candidatus Paceibacterota bacterium]
MMLDPTSMMLLELFPWLKPVCAALAVAFVGYSLEQMPEPVLQDESAYDEDDFPSL